MKAQALAMAISTCPTLDGEYGAVPPVPPTTTTTTHSSLALAALPHRADGTLDLPRGDYAAYLRMWPREDTIGYPMSRDGGPLAAWLGWRVEERTNRRPVVRINTTTGDVRLAGHPTATLALPAWAVRHQQAIAAQPEKRWTAGELLRMLALDEQAEAKAAGWRPTVGAGLAAIRQALGELLDVAPMERVQALCDAIVAGHMDGACYTGSSRCVRGWLEAEETEHSFLVEAFLYPVLPGHTPETSGRLRRILAWTDAWRAELDAVPPDAEALDWTVARGAVMSGKTFAALSRAEMIARGGAE